MFQIYSRVLAIFSLKWISRNLLSNMIQWHHLYKSISYFCRNVPYSADRLISDGTWELQYILSKSIHPHFPFTAEKMVSSTTAVSSRSMLSTSYRLLAGFTLCLFYVVLQSARLSKEYSQSRPLKFLLDDLLSILHARACRVHLHFIY